ncbi:NAD(P)H-binding protein [Saccharomonospora sp. NPDC006951]
MSENNHEPAPGTVLVTGATGAVGRNVVENLVAQGIPVRALTRNPDAARLPSAADVAEGSHTDPRQLESLLTGIESVFFMWPDLGNTAPAVSAIDRIAAQAKRIVFLSSAAVDGDAEPTAQSTPIGEAHREIEVAIERSGLDWTFLRPRRFATAALEWAADIREDRPVKHAFGDVPITLIDERDIADVAALTLTRDGYTGQALELTGPELITPKAAVRRIADHIGTPARWEDMPEREWIAELRNQGWAEEAVDFLLRGYQHPQDVLSTVEQVTGKPARDFDDWLSAHRTDFTIPLPVATLPDAEVVIMTTWTVQGKQQQLAAADAAMAAWDSVAWPEGLLHYSVLLGTDGTSLLHYSQWSGEHAIDLFQRTDPPARVEGILAAVPGIRRNGGARYTRYRSQGRANPQHVGCVAVVSFETANRGIAESFVDELTGGADGESPDEESPIGINFLISTDGASLVNYAEFPDEQTHQTIVETQLGPDNPVPALIERTEGLEGLGFRRYLPYRARKPNRM